MSEKLPLEILKEKYIPVTRFAEEYHIDSETVMGVIKKFRVRYAEFKAPGEIRRTPHVNPEDILPVLYKEGYINESDNSI